MYIFLVCDMVFVMECNNVIRNKVILYEFVICDIIFRVKMCLLVYI